LTKHTLNVFSFLCIFVANLLFATHEDTVFEEDKDTTVLIKVLLEENLEGALIDVQGSYKVYNPEKNKVISSGSKGKRYYLQTTETGLKWGEGYPGIYQIRIEPNDSESSILINGIQYKGSIEAYNINSKIQLVNILDVEDLLISVLSEHFFSKKYHSITYDALSIIARTNFYHAVAKNSNPYWDLLASEINYCGYASKGIHSDIERAIIATKNLILTFNDQPFATTWTENCAGHTASFQSIFRKKFSGPEGVAVAYAQKERMQNRWKCTLSKGELAKILSLDTITSIDLFCDQSTKKVYALRIASKNKFVEIPFDEFQKLIGKNRVLSNDFTAHVVKEHISFDGYGKGFGVGLCLFSADYMAKSGNSTPQILSHFYPTTHLVKLGYIPDSFKETQKE